ncbi:histidine kinase [Dactylosporangium sp. NPDC000555]|uniref:sensor histidine kinase n=1 Tax=Dactylosporangium sp. NPDC000555 TaxID=3154260 RepID=UPI00331DDD2B
MTDHEVHPIHPKHFDLPGRLKNIDRRHPRLLDGFVPAASALVSLPVVLGGENSDGLHHIMAMIGLAALVLPLWWWRRAPLVAFVTFELVLSAEWLLGIRLPTYLAQFVLLYSVAARGSSRAVACACGFMTAMYSLAAGTLWHGGPGVLLRNLLTIGGLSAAAVATGLTVRTHRAYLSSLESRAARLEIEREQSAQLAAAHERARIAREMHDIVGHHVSVIVGLADGGASLADSRGERTAEPLRLIGETGRQALTELRRVLGVLRDVQQDQQWGPQPGIADIEDLLPALRSAGLAVTYRTEGEFAALSRGLQLTAYRIVQEALTNTLNHAGPGVAVDVALRKRPGEMTITVRDYGAPAHGTPGNGIAGIRERAALYDGTVKAGPSDDGWLVEAILKEPA